MAFAQQCLATFPHIQWCKKSTAKTPACKTTLSPQKWLCGLVLQRHLSPVFIVTFSAFGGSVAENPPASGSLCAGPFGARRPLSLRTFADATRVSVAVRISKRERWSGCKRAVETCLLPTRSCSRVTVTMRPIAVRSACPRCLPRHLGSTHLPHGVVPCFPAHSADTANLLNLVSPLVAASRSNCR